MGGGKFYPPTKTRSSHGRRHAAYHVGKAALIGYGRVVHVPRELSLARARMRPMRWGRGREGAAEQANGGRTVGGGGGEEEGGEIRMMLRESRE